MSQAHLPHLRQELQILMAPRGEDGAPQWFIFDPVRNAFHMIGEKGLSLLKQWTAGPIKQMTQKLADDNLTETDILAMSDFLYAQQLTIEPPGGQTSHLADREAAKRRPFYEILVHRYLFFRIPLFAPDKFLRATYPLLLPLFTKWTLIITAIIGAAGLYFALGQWDQFIRTFWHFFTLEGLVFYVLALAVIKSLHELGHAFIAHHFGARVPTLGIAFLVMFPILYTDTTDAWRLLDKRKRLLIDSGGIIVEIMIACISLCLWAFLPDGPMRSLAFFAATTSWAFSLLVNLNPCMRFDGYYIISDMFGLKNLQKTGFALGRWKMRELLFDLGAPQPNAAEGGRLIGLLSYAYTTWVYRFFLFIGIALLVHHMFPKAIGIILFSIEIIFFIIRPIWAEFKNWWSFRMDIVSRVRARFTLLIFCLLALLVVWPFSYHVNAPARIEPSARADIFPPQAAKIIKIHTQNEAIVKTGDLLFTLSSSRLDFDISQVRGRIGLLDAQIARQNSNLQERRSGTTLDDERRREQAALDGLMLEREKLIIRAPQDGRISNIPSSLHTDRIVMNTQILARISSQGAIKLLALAPEDDAGRILPNADIKFIANDPAFPAIKAQLSHQAPTARAVIYEKELTSTFGGKIAVQPETEHGLIPVNPVYEIRADILPMNESYDAYSSGRTIGGLVKIKGSREAYAVRIGRQILRVLIREGDF